LRNEIANDQLQIKIGTVILKETEAKNQARRDLICQTQIEIVIFSKQLEETKSLIEEDCAYEE